MALRQPAMLNLSIDQICEAGVINKGMDGEVDLKGK